MKELNLIPYSLKEKRLKEFRKRQYIAYGALALIVMFLIGYVPRMYLATLKAKEQQLNAQAIEGRVIIAESNKIKIEIDNLNKRKVLIDGIKSQKVSVGDRILELNKYAPSDLVVSNLNYANNAMVLGGITRNYNSISEFVANLQNSKEYKSVKIASISGAQGQGGDYAYIINIMY